MIHKRELLFENILGTVKQLDVSSITMERRSILQVLIDFVQEKKDTGSYINLNFVCTHNSRRSHLAQIWAQTWSVYFGIPNVFCYSGGTEATALFPKVVETLSNAGFEIAALSKGNNPIYVMKYAAVVPPIIGFSKTYDHPFNPTSDFAAVMTCSHADENCPFIPGAEKRIPLTFDDPKVYDDTPLQDEKYAERSMQIATELYYVFAKIE